MHFGIGQESTYKNPLPVAKKGKRVLEKSIIILTHIMLFLFIQIIERQHIVRIPHHVAPYSLLELF